MPAPAAPFKVAMQPEPNDIWNQDSVMDQNRPEDDEPTDEELLQMVAESDARGGGTPLAGELNKNPLTDEEINNIVAHEIQDATGYYAGELAETRMRSMDYYLARPRGDEMAGRSQVISTDVADAIEWILPQAIKALTSEDSVVRVDPAREGGEADADAQTAYLNHVFNKENDGWLNTYTVVKDALMQKNGVWKVFFCESDDIQQETYENLDVPALQKLLQPQDGTEVVVIEHDQHEGMGMDPQTGQFGPTMLFDIKLKRIQKEGQITVDPIPPEEFLLNRDHECLDLSGARFTAHKRIVTESTLIQEGWEQSMVESLPSYTVDDTGERERRRELEDEKDWGQAPHDSANRRVLVYECYCLIDHDRDGVAEMLKVDTAGYQGQVIMGWEVVDGNPFVGTTGIMLTHKFFGLSIYDRLKQIQDTKTWIERQINDNLSHQNNARMAVVAGQVNLDDLLTSRPGGVVRQRAPGMIEPLVAPQIGDAGYKMLEYQNSVRQGRVGVSPDTAEVASSVAGDTAHGVERLMSAKEELTALMIALMAMSLMRPTFMKIRELAMKHRPTSCTFLHSGKWLNTNPREWDKRCETTVDTMLGRGDQMRKQSALGAVMATQKVLVEGGMAGVLVTEKNIHRAACDWVRASNLGDPSAYYTDPTSKEAQQARQQKQQAQQKGEQKEEKLVMMAAQLENQKNETNQLKLQVDGQKATHELMFKYQEMFEKLEQKYTELELEHNTDVPGKGMTSKPANGTGASA